MTLTSTQINDYHRDGFVVLESFFDPTIIADVDGVIERITCESIASGNTDGVMELEPQQDGDLPRPRRILNPFEQDETFRRMITCDRLLDSIESLIGSDIELQYSKLNFKPARVGSPVEWHQDLAYYPHTNDSLVTVLMYIDNATEQNGCLRVLPRHHHHYFDHALPDGSFAGMISEELDDGRFGKPVPLPAPSGSVILMHPITPHSSHPNQSDHSRRTLIVSFRATDAAPIWFSERVTQAQKHAHLVRGKTARFARFGGPAPVLPRYGESGKFQSLYSLQDEAKKQQTLA